MDHERNTMTEHITALETADLLGVSLNQIRQLTFQRKLNVTAKRGRTVLYDKDTIRRTMTTTDEETPHAKH
jgi:hypothetical protein